jgi:hypothetical protein
MTPEEKQKRIAELEARLAELEASEMPEVEEPGILEMAGRGLNLAGGAVRGTLAGAIEPLIGKDIISAEEIASGTVPGSAELMDRAGVGEGFSLSDIAPGMYSETGEGLTFQKGGFFDPTARGIVGLAADIATDPLTYLAAPLKAAQAARAGTVAGKALKLAEIAVNPMGEAVAGVGTGLQKGGKALYKSAFEKADQALETRYGKGSIADILKSRGFKGSAQKAIEKTQEINKQLGEQIGSYRQKADLTGILEKPLDFTQAEKVVQKYQVSSDPEMMSIADNLQQILDSYKGMPAKTATELATVKRTNLDMAGGDTAFDMLKSSPDRAKAELRRAIGKSLGEAEDSAIKQSLSPKEFKDYIQTKRDYGVTTKYAQKELNKLARNELVRTGVAPSAVDVMGTAAAIASGQPVAMAGMAAKKARDIMRLTGTKTRLGPLMETVGGGIESTAAKVPPQVWLEMLGSKPEGEEQ